MTKKQFIIFAAVLIFTNAFAFYEGSKVNRVFAASPIWIEVKHPPTIDKVCVVGENWIDSKDVTCLFDEVVIKEHPMFILMPVPPSEKKLPNRYDIYYQCSYKYKCEGKK